MADMQTLLKQARISLAAERVAPLETYHAMLLDWNTRMDLTSVDPEHMAARHFLDSLAPLRHETLFPLGIRAIDVGTGAGFPGLALAIARPDLRFTLLEAQGKRCQFLQAVKSALELDNVEILQERAEVAGQDPAHREQYDRAVARAVAPLNILAEYLLPFVKVGGCALCWKGPAVTEEWADGQAAAARLGGAVEPLVETDIPGLDRRHIVVPIRKTEKTLPQYPRKNGIPAKRPLKDDKK